MSQLTKTVKFMNNNLAYEGDGSTVTYSSDAADGPNMADENLSKIWSPFGNWTIDSTNNKLYLTGFTCTIAEGEYTSSELETAIETALEAQVGTWTVDYNGATEIWTITYDSGPGNLDLIFSNQTNAVWKDIGFNDDTDVTLSVLGSLSGAENRRGRDWIEVDFGHNANAIQFVACMPQRIGGAIPQFDLNSNSDVRLKLDNNPDNWESPAVEINIDPTDAGIFYFLDEEDCNYRYLRLEFRQRQGNIRISHFYAGDYIPITGRNVRIGYQKQPQDRTSVQESESGRRYFNTRGSFEGWANMALEYVPRANRRDIETFWAKSGRHEPFYISIDPTTNISDDLSELTRFVYFDSQLGLNHIIRDLYNITFSVRDVV